MVYRENKPLGRRAGQANVSGWEGTCVLRSNNASGFTLIEIVIVAGLIASLSMIVVPRLLGYAQRNKDQQAIVDITKMSTEITHYIMDYNVPPDSLDDVGFGNLLDPWGRPYEYLKIIDNPDPGVNGKQRKDHSLVPVNSDYDLYSRGADGVTGAPFTDKKSRDDIVRASNGAFIGLVTDF
jgi:general secretion pathway protein G